VRCLKDCEGEFTLVDSPIFYELHKAYFDARKNKRNTTNQLRFEHNLEIELISLCRELETKTYELKPGICFINDFPVKREVIAADFRDRVIHHFIYNRINNIFDRQFIYDSYSCRENKGTLFGINRVKKFLKQCGNPWVLRLDIKGFFMAIDRDILFKLTMEGLKKNKCELIEFLVHKIIFNDPIKTAIFRSLPSAWNDLPPDKSLMGSAANCGLPIGNLTSQIFANVYLNPLDQFVKRVLKIKRYGRYVDDMVFIDNDKNILLNAISSVREFLANELNLTLHPKKIKLQHSSKGFAFLGAYIYPNRIMIGKRIMQNFRKAVFSENNIVKVQSYLGLLKHFN
jgi:hypothetical protein